MDENEVYEEGLTFKELFSYIWKKKIVGIIIAVVTLVVSFLGMFLYSNSSAKYICRYELTWEGIENNQYPDGSSFKYRDTISIDNIEYVIENNEQLSYLTPQKLLDKDNLKINYFISYIDDDNKELGTRSYYIIESSADVFKETKDAKLFFDELITHQYDIALKKINDYRFDNALDSVIATTEYDVIFTLIKNQLESVNKYLEKVTEKHAADFVYDVEKEVTIRDLKNNIKDFENQYYSDTVEYQYVIKNYVRNLENTQNKFEVEKTNILKEIDLKEHYLDRLAEEAKNLNGQNGTTNGTITSDAYINTVAPVLQEILELNRRLEYLQSSNLTYNADYDKKVNSYIDGLDVLTKEANKVQKAIGLDSIDLNYATSEIIESKSFGLVKSLILSVVIAIVLPFIVLLIMCLVKRPGHDKPALEAVKEEVIENNEEPKQE